MRFVIEDRSAGYGKKTKKIDQPHKRDRRNKRNAKLALQRWSDAVA